MIAMNSPNILTYFIPNIGFVPDWCLFLNEHLQNLFSKLNLSSCKGFNDVFNSEIINLCQFKLINLEKIDLYPDKYIKNDRMLYKFCFVYETDVKIPFYHKVFNLLGHNVITKQKHIVNVCVVKHSRKIKGSKK